MSRIWTSSNDKCQESVLKVSRKCCCKLSRVQGNTHVINPEEGQIQGTRDQHLLFQITVQATIQYNDCDYYLLSGIHG